MDWKTFIADLVDSLAWPAAVAFVAFLLRGQLRDLLKRVRKARYGQAEAEFGESVDEGESLAEQVPLPPPEVEPGVDQRIRKADPRAAVLEAWIEVEDALEKFASSAGLTSASPRKLSGVSIARRLREKKLIPPTLTELIAELQRGRNAAVHVRKYEVDPTEVAAYQALAARTVAYLNEHAEQTGLGPLPE